MMPSLMDTRAAILDAILEKHLAGKLSWQPRKEKNSYEVSVGDFTYNLDQNTMSSGLSYRLWIFDQSGSSVDNFSMREVKDKSPANISFDSYIGLAYFIYHDIKEKSTLERISPALEQLKKN